MEQFHIDRFRLYSLFLLSSLLIVGIFTYINIEITYAADGCGGQELTPSVPQDNALEFIHLLNLERRQQQLPPYKASDELLLSSRYHTVDMYEDGYFKVRTHDVIDGVLTPLDDCGSGRRIKSFYESDSEPDFTSTVLGTIGAGEFLGGQILLDTWLEISSIQRDLLSPDFREIGVGLNTSVQEIAINAVGDLAVDLDQFPLIINNEAISTNERSVELYIYGEWDEVRLRNEWGAWGEWVSFTNDLGWELSAGGGTKIVSAEMRNNDPNATYASALSMDRIMFVGGGGNPSTETPSTPTPVDTATPIPADTATPLPTPVDTFFPTITPDPNGGTLFFTWRSSAMPVVEGQTFSIEVELTGENITIVAPDVTISLPDGLVIEGYSANNEGLSTFIEDQRVVWYPVLGEELGIYAYPAVLTLDLRVVSVGNGSGGFVNNFTIEGSTDRDESSTFSIPVTPPTIPIIISPTPTDTPSPTATNTPSPTATNTPSPTATNTPSPTATNTPSPTATNTPSPTATNTPSPTATNTPSPTATNTPSPTATFTPRPDPIVITFTPTPPSVATSLPISSDTPSPTSLPPTNLIQMEFEAPSIVINPGDPLSFSLIVGGEGISAPTIILTLPDELSFAGYSTNNEVLPIARPDTQTLVWYSVIAQITNNYPYPAVLDVSVQLNGAHNALHKVAEQNGELVIEAAAYIDGELLAISLLTLQAPSLIIPTPTTAPTEIPAPTETPIPDPTSIPPTDIPPTQAPSTGAENSSKEFNFVWERSSAIIQPGDSFDVTLTLTGSQLSAPNTSISLPSGFSLDSYESNNEFLTTELYGQTVVWHPMVGQEFINYGTPATFTFYLTAAEEMERGEYTISLSTLSGARSSFTIPVGSQQTSLEEPPLLQFAIDGASQMVTPGETITLILSLTASGVISPEVVFMPRPGLSIDSAEPNNLREPIEQNNDGSLTWRPVVDNTLTEYAYPATIDLSLTALKGITQSTSLLITNGNQTLTIVPFDMAGIDTPLAVSTHSMSVATLPTPIYAVLLGLLLLTAATHNQLMANDD